MYVRDYKIRNISECFLTWFIIVLHLHISPKVEAVIFFSVLGIEPRAFSVLSKHFLPTFSFLAYLSLLYLFIHHVNGRMCPCHRTRGGQKSPCWSQVFPSFTFQGPNSSCQAWWSFTCWFILQAPIPFSLFSSFKDGSCYIAQADLEFGTPPPPTSGVLQL